jgi:O-antigen/teichoic acid export membrane protein
MSSSFLRQAAILTSGTITAQAITVLATPFISRAYTASDYGQAAIFSSLASIVFTIAPLRYEAQIVLPRSESKAASLAFIAAISTACLCVVLTAVLLLGGNALRLLLGIESLGSYSLLAVLLGGLMSGVAICSNWLNRHKAYRTLATIRVLQSLLAAILSLSFAVRLAGPGLILAQAIATVATLCIAVVLTAKASPIPTHFDSPLITAQEFRRAPMFLLPTSFLDVLSQQLPVFLIAGWFSEQLTGHYRMAYSLICLPSALVGTALGQVFFSHFASAWPDKQKAKGLLFRTWAGLFTIGAPAFSLIWLAGPKIFSWALGDQWAESGRIAAMLAPMALVNFTSSPTSTSFLVLGLERLSLLFGIMVLAYRPAALLLGAQLGNLNAGIMAMVICEIAGVLIYQFVAITYMNRSASP